MRVSLLVMLLFATGCEQERSFTERKRVLDSFPYIDCGVVVPGDRVTCPIPLFSQEAGPVRIFDIAAADLNVAPEGAGPDGSFIVLDSAWKSDACEDGTCLELAGYDDESDDDTHVLDIVFAPLVEGYYHGELTIWSNDSTSKVKEGLPDKPEQEYSVWKVQLRGLSRPACGYAWPSLIDYGRRNTGGDFPASAYIQNCGIVTLSVNGAPEVGTGQEEMSLMESLPLYVLPGQVEEIPFNFAVPSETDGAPTPVTDLVQFESNSALLMADSVTLIGNDCTQSVDTSWDEDADGWFFCGGDCDDQDATVNPSRPERPGNAPIDDDCDGEIDEAANPVGSDDDGDGYTETQGDCDDADGQTSPDAVESANQIDDDCDGTVDNGTESYDDDRDGFSEREGDSDDASRLVGPAVPETLDDVDNDGDGFVDEGTNYFDDDQDGYKEDEEDPALNDPDDGDPWVYAGAFEFCDRYDNDGDHLVDEGEDDAADGACAFLPKRTTDAVAGEEKGCATAPADGRVAFGLLGILYAVVLVARRSRD